MKGKTREKFVCKGRLVVLNVEIARVAMVEVKFSKCCHDDAEHAQTLFSPVAFRKFLSYSGFLLCIRKSCCVLKKTVVFWKRLLWSVKDCCVSENIVLFCERLLCSRNDCCVLKKFCVSEGKLSCVLPL